MCKGVHIPSLQLIADADKPARCV